MRPTIKNKEFRRGKVAYVLALSCFLLLFVAKSLPADGRATYSNADSRDRSPRVSLRVDARQHARAFYDSMPVIVGIADFFEFYEQNLTGGRTRISHGPWSGKLEENSAGAYTLQGIDSEITPAYTVVLKQIDPSTIELSFRFKAPNRPSSLGFDIVKLSGDLFKNASIEASPVETNDSSKISDTPLPFAKRMLLTNKNRVRLRGVLCDLEIRDLTDARTIYVADGRNVPWDRKKSIQLGVEKRNIVPSSYHSFKYSIRCLPPSNAELLQKAKVYGSPENTVNPWLFFSPPPKEERKDSGRYRVQTGDIVYGSPTGTGETMLIKEIEKTTSILLNIKPVESTKTGRGIVIERIQGGKISGLPPEGFEIVVSAEKVIIRGTDERGCLYGVYALMGHLRYISGRWEIGCGTIRDWPDLPIRGICVELLPPAIRGVAIAKRYLDAFSRARSNVVVFLHNPPQVRAWMRNTDDGGWTKEQMAEIAQYARSLHMDVWGGMGSGFNSADFRELDIRKGTNLYNPFKAASYDYLFSLYDGILQTYQPSTLLIGHDEIKGLSVYAAESGRTTSDILATDVKRIHAWLSQRNVRTTMWGDMLLDFSRWDSEVGSANSLNPAFNSGATHLAVQQIPKDVLILDWHYGERKTYGSLEYFHQNGLTVVGSPWHDPNAAKALAGSVRRYGGQGIITTDWGLLRTLAPAATTLYAPLCGWSTACQTDKTNNDVTALAETMRDSLYAENRLKEVTISLSAVSNRSTIEISDGLSNGMFGIGPVLDLRAMSPGKQVFGGISFDVASANGGHNNNCVVIANGGDQREGLPSGKDVFQGSTRAQAVAFLHTSFVEEPQVEPRKLGQYVVVYEDGHSEAIDLVENWNITDIRSSEGLRRNDWTFSRMPDVLIGAKPAWRGVSAAGIPLNVQVFIWRNAYPEKKIRSIRLKAAMAPQNSKIALLGLTFLL